MPSHYGLHAARLAPTRDPTESELRFFKANPQIGGYASFTDGFVVVNPFNTLTPQENEALIENESARIFMRRQQAARPSFQITPEQQQAFAQYPPFDPPADPGQSVRETIAARVLSGDPSAGELTPEQALFAQGLKQRMLK